MGKFLFLFFAALCIAPLFPIDPFITSLVAPTALTLGVVLALTVGHPFGAFAKKISRTLLQTAVVLLGFSMDLDKVLTTGRDGLLFSLVSIAMVFTAGWLVQKVLQVRQVTGVLISGGTAICGGSAIAALSSVLQAPEEDVTVSVGTVFILNGIALLIFPPIGHALGLTQTQFGLWAGIAIHDVASVAGAGAAYGPVALGVATSVKLARVLYLVPVTLITAVAHHKMHQTADQDGVLAAKKPLPIPWFVGLFLIAAFLRGYLLPLSLHLGFNSSDWAKKVATAGFALSLFLIGSLLSVKTLKAVGVRPLIMGAILWLLISVVSLVAIWSNWVRI